LSIDWSSDLNCLNFRVPLRIQIININTNTTESNNHTIKQKKIPYIKDFNHIFNLQQSFGTYLMSLVE